MRQENSTNIRKGERRTFQGAVQVSWQARAGEMKVMRAKCLDISEHGARIESTEPIEVRTNALIQAPAFGIMGNASVRYCRRTGVKYIIGFQFSSAVSQADRGRQRCLTEIPPGAEK